MARDTLPSKYGIIKCLPLNPRSIDRAAFKKLRESIKRDPQFMRLRPIVVDDNCMVLGGNQRLKACIANGMDKLPDEWVIKAENMTEDQRRRFVIVDNAPTGMSGDWDIDMLKNNWSDVDLSSFGFELDMSADGELEAGGDDDGAEEPEPELDRGVFALREDAVFKSDDKYGIPALLPDMLANPPVPPSCWAGGDVEDNGMLMLWGSNAIPKDVKKGILAFYVDDYRFESVWNDAVSTIDKLRSHDFGAVIAPDFSIWRDDPIAVQIWNTYRNRWVARYWQECGIKIIPSMCWSDEKSYDFTFSGIPVGAPVVSCQCRTTRGKKGMEYFFRGIAQGIEMLKPLSVWMYGGVSHRSEMEPFLPTGVKYEWLDSWTEARRRKRSK